jgi:acyl-CoA reductase-like NAD-dependent aldehyde dehydrogenase
MMPRLYGNKITNKLDVMAEVKLTAKQAFENAEKAKAVVGKLSVKERVVFIGKLKSYILQNREMLIDRIQADTGKSRSDALMSEIFGILDHLAYLWYPGSPGLPGEVCGEDPGGQESAYSVGPDG